MNNTLPAALRDFFRDHPRLALAFSGGCDSAYLLYAAAKCGADVQAYYVHSCFQPAFELEDARRVAGELNLPLKVLETDVLADAQVKSNPADRCYHCKRRIFEAILQAAHADGYDTIIDGTNASDDASDRPGMRALAEMRVLSPLRMCGVSKAQVRAYSREAGLFTWNKPAYACLATRIPVNMPIEAELLKRIEAAENAIAGMGFSGFRARITSDGVRLELPEEQMDMLIRKRSEVVAALQDDFSRITLDLRPRREREP